MNVTAPKANPKSNDGGLLVDGLFVDDKGNTEPVFIIRASEPAALEALLAYLDSARQRHYNPRLIEEGQKQLAKFADWQRSQGIIPRQPDEWSIEKDAVPVKAGKK